MKKEIFVKFNRFSIKIKIFITGIDQKKKLKLFQKQEIKKKH